MFVVAGSGVRAEIASMPGQYRLSIDQLVPEIKRVADAGVRAVMLFGVPSDKDDTGVGAFARDGIVQEATIAIKGLAPDLVVVVDTCLCEYTANGQCMIFRGERPDPSATLETLAKTAVSQAQAGADIVAPSGMVDGMVRAIREGLDDNNLTHIPIMSYAVKYASAFYGPFRDAVDSAPAGDDPAFLNRAWHQMDPPNSREAIREAQLDVEEGADFLMVKPGMPYLDILAQLRQRFPHPMAVYQVSGEYAMIEAAAANGWIDRDRAVVESLVAFKRAGADLILTYFALDALERGLIG
jgi:porphobilinogen synthase